MLGRFCIDFRFSDRLFRVIEHFDLVFRLAGHIYSELFEGHFVDA